MANPKPTPIIIGYARVSTDGQALDQQIETLRRAGATKIFSEKQSGAKSDRKELARALASLLPGDTLVVTRLYRLARSTLDLLHTLDVIARKGAGFRSLADHWCDTSTPHGKLMLTVLGGLAEFERSLILARTGEGMARAKAAGVKFGRKLKLDLHQRREALERLAAGEPASVIARTYRCDPTTIMRIRWREEEREGVVHHLPVPVAASLLRTLRRR